MMESHCVREKSKFQFNLNIHSTTNLKMNIRLRWESKHIRISSIPVLIWVFINRKKNVVTLALNSKIQLLNKRQEEKYQTYLTNKTMTRDIKANEKFLPRNNPQNIASLTFDLRKVLNVYVLLYSLTCFVLLNKNRFS